MNPLIRQYLSEIEQTRSAVTAKLYTERLKRFDRFIKQRTVFDRQLATDFLLWLKPKFSPSFVSATQSTLKSFYGWLTQHGHIAHNWLQTNVLPAYHSTKRADDFPFTEAEYERIKAHCQIIQRDDQLFWHNAVIAAWNTGLRLKDIAYLNIDQIDLAELKVTVVPSKTKRLNKTVEIPILPELEAMIRSNHFRPYLFPEMATSYDQFGHSRLSEYFSREILGKCGITGKSFHSFRHNFCTKLLNSGAPLPVVSSITGQTMSTLQRYSHVSFAEKTNAVLLAMA